MSLNCMNCHILPRTDSNIDMNKSFTDNSEKPKQRCEDHSKVRSLRSMILAERNWSGNLIPPPTYSKIDESIECGTPKKKAKKVHRRSGSMGTVLTCQEDDLGHEPKLVRSGGIRRDWSFEDLDSPKREGKRKQRT